MRVVFQKVISPGIAKLLCQKTFSAYSIPITSPHLATEHHGTLFNMGCQRLQFIVFSFNFVETLVRFFFTTGKQSDQSDPFGLSERGQLFVAQMRNQGYASFFQGFISSAFKR